MPYWHKAAYRKGLIEEFSRKNGDDVAVPDPGSQVSEEGLAALEARGVQVIRKG